MHSCPTTCGGMSWHCNIEGSAISALLTLRLRSPVVLLPFQHSPSWQSSGYTPVSCPRRRPRQKIVHMQHALGVEGNGMLPLTRYEDAHYLGLHDLLRLSICIPYDTCHHTTFECRRTWDERLQAAQHRGWKSSPRPELWHVYLCNASTTDSLCYEFRLTSIVSPSRHTSSDRLRIRCHRVIAPSPDTHCDALIPTTNPNQSIRTCHLCCQALRRD